jgi:DNA-directed RNA polymerase subunit RPC12/RpoP
MTIRDYLKRREFLAKIAGWGCGVAAFYVAFRYFRDSSRPYAVYGCAIGLACIAVFWLQQQLVRCPRCSGSLLRLYTQISFGDVQACPHCRASFDEPNVR